MRPGPVMPAGAAAAPSREPGFRPRPTHTSSWSCGSEKPDNPSRSAHPRPDGGKGAVCAEQWKSNPKDAAFMLDASAPSDETQTQSCVNDPSLDSNLAEEHRRWLAGFDERYLLNWEKLPPEPAMCEAGVRQILQENGNTVEPAESLTGEAKRPDFSCRQAGKVFFVEVTCISIDKAAEYTGLTDIPSKEVRGFSYRHLNDQIFWACREKTPQCSGLGHPAIVAVCTYHWDASNLCSNRFHLKDLLTGERVITHHLDARTHCPVGETHEVTLLESATFFRPDGIGWAQARNCVSGIVFCGLGCIPPIVRGVLHPNPAFPLDRKLLPKIEFCRLRPGYESGEMTTEWI